MVLEITEMRFFEKLKYDPAQALEFVREGNNAIIFKAANACIENFG